MLINAQPESKKEAFLPSVLLTAREQVARRGPQAQQEHGPLCLLLAGAPHRLIMLLSIILTTMSRLEQVGPCELGCVITESHIFQASLTLIDQDPSSLVWKKIFCKFS